MVTKWEVNQWPCLRDLSISQARASDDKLLISQDCPQALVPLSMALGTEGEPFAVRTCLGWTVNGPITGERSVQEPTVCCTQATSLVCNVSHVNPTNDLLRLPCICRLPKGHVLQEPNLVTSPQRNQPTKRNPGLLLVSESQVHNCRLNVQADRRHTTRCFDWKRWLEMLACLLLFIQLSSQENLLLSESLTGTENRSDGGTSRGTVSCICWKYHCCGTVEWWNEWRKPDRAMINWCTWKKSGLQIGKCYCQSASCAYSREPLSKTAACRDNKELVNGPSSPFGGEDVAGSINPRSLPVCTRKRFRESRRMPDQKRIEIRPISGRLQSHRRQLEGD